MNTLAALIITIASVCAAQDYRLALVHGTELVMAVGGTRAYADNQLVPVTYDIFRGHCSMMFVPDHLPTMVLDAAGPVAVGIAANFGPKTMEGLVWDGSHAPLIVDREGYRIARINGTDGTNHVGYRASPNGPYATRWDQWGIAHNMHPPTASSSLVEDTSGGLSCGVIDDTWAALWLTDYHTARLAKPDWADVQTWARGIAGLTIVGDGTGSHVGTRPLAWIEGECVVLADRIGLALDVNASGVAVGWVGSGVSSTGVAWALPSTEPIDLSARVRMPAGLQIVAAYAVSDAGHIAVECLMGGQRIGGVLVHKGVQ